MDSCAIDALVAEKVMGLPVCRCEKDHRGFSVHKYRTDTGGCFGCNARATERYASDPGTSKHLREKLAGQWSVHVVHYSARQQYVGRRASCRLMLNGEVIASTEADTEELAVALSALKSVGVDVEALHG